MFRKSVSVIIFGVWMFLAIPGQLCAQLDGSGIAPDFTITDVNGTEHTLYNYLDDGVVVVLDFFAVWCGICQGNASYVEDLYLEYGPEGSGKIEILSLEADAASSDEQVINYAIEFAASNPHVNDTENTVEDYHINFFPTYYVIAPDRSYKIMPGVGSVLQSNMEAAILEAPGLREVDNDIRILSFDQPKGALCNEVFSPQLVVQNYGRNEISSFDVQTYVDGSLLHTRSFGEIIPAYQLFSLTVPEISGLHTGWHELEFVFVNVNGQMDGDPYNGVRTSDFLILENKASLVVNLNADSYPEELWWNITQNGRVIVQKLNYKDPIRATPTDVCLEEDSCYRLTLYDRYGDGMSFGNLEVLYQDEVIGLILAENFGGSSISIDFCVHSGSTGIEDLSSFVEFNIYPNPGDGRLTIEMSDYAELDGNLEIFNVFGQKLLFQSVVGPDNLTIDLSDQPDGIYFVHLRTKDAIFTRRLLINR